MSDYVWPGVPESRLFYDAGDRDYEISRHTKVVPASFRTGPLHNGFWIVGYNERSPVQLRARAADRISTGWQRTHYADIDGSVGVRSLHERSPTGTFDAAHHDPRYGRARPVTDLELPLSNRQTSVTPIFLGGVGRTGSRLTRDLLAASPAITALPMEMKFISWPAGAIDLAHQPNLNLRRLARWWTRMLDFRPSAIPDEAGGPTSNWGYRANLASTDPALGYPEALRHVTGLLASHRLADADRRTVVREFVHWLLDRHASPQRFWVEQTPANIDQAHNLLATFPTARLWNVIRDPRDTVASLTRAWWGPSKPEEAAAIVVESWERWQAFQASSSHAERAGLIRFEDLVADPARTVGSVWEQLDCSPADAALVVPEPSNQPAKRTDLSAAQQKRIEVILWPVLAGQGY